MFKIGKIAAKKKVQLEKGLACMNDFLLILDHKKPEMKENIYIKMRCHGLYYMGIIYFHLGDKTNAESYLRDVYFDLLEMEKSTESSKVSDWKSEKV